VGALVEVGENECMNLFLAVQSEPLAASILFGNHAPLWVFFLLGLVIGIMLLALYLATSVGGGEKDYWYGDRSRRHYLNYPSYGPFGGFTQF
jgi:hypothetical protein